MDDRLPLFRHPTTTVLVDEGEQSLSQLEGDVDPAKAAIAFMSPAQALQWIFKHQAAIDALRPLAPMSESGAQEGGALQHDLEAIYRYVGDPQRFSAPSVVVIEYKRPSKAAMQVCEAVAHLPVKRVWRSRPDQQEDGVEAFQRRLVDHFEQSGPGRNVTRLRAVIERLEIAYFRDMTAAAHSPFLDPEAYRFLDDPVFEALVQDQIDRYGFVEYYLFTSPSGLLFFDADGRATLMVVQTEDSMVSQFELARDNQAPPELLRDLFQCRVVPFFQTGDGHYSSNLAGNPADYCKPAAVCRGASDYYWALFDLPQGLVKGTPYSHARWMRGADRG